MKRLLFVLIIVPNLLFAEGKFDTLKFEMIKETVVFLATDTLFHSSKFTADCGLMDYKCLTTSSSGLKGVGSKIEKWEKLVAKSYEDLARLKATIYADVISKEDGRRTKLKNYEQYNGKMVELITAPGEPPPPPPPGISLNEADIKYVSEMIDAKIKEAAKSDTNYLGWIALCGAVMALIVALISLARRGQKQSSGNGDLTDIVENLEGQISKLRSQLERKVSQKDLEDKVNKIESQLSRIESEIRKKPEPEQLPLPTKRLPEVKTVSNQLKYAKLPDLGNGFSSSNFSDSQNGEQIYQIEINGDRGSYSISNDPGAQRYALSDFNYYLSGACDYTNQPMKNCTINTSRKGTLIKSSGNWIIENKALIEFS